SGATPQTTIVVDGFRKKHTRALIDENDAFHIGSVTKSMTAVLIGMAVSDGLIRYDDTLEQLFPQLTIHPSLRNVRLKALLLHEAGIGTIDRISREMSPSQIATWEKIERAQMDVVQARLWVSQAFLARPKKVSPRNVYSNVGYMVLGHLLEQLYQKPWETLVSEKLFSPIGMNHCGFGPTSLEGDPDQSPSTIWGHYFESDIYNPVHYDNPPVYGPAGTVHCSLGDLAKYVSFQMDLYHGRSTIVSPVVAQGLFAAANAEGDTLGSWVRMPDLTTPLLSFKGSNQLNMAFVYLVPDRDRAMIVTLNAGDDNADAAAEAAVPLAAQAFSKF
ncbi:MAG: class A beta-lactamase-related serine hydrolase, partial [Proteobacteria bacterium]